MMHKGILQTILLISVGGMVLALFLVSQHYRITSSGIPGESFCNINDYVNCDVVNGSVYSEFMKVPVAGLGFIYLLTIFLYLLPIVISGNPKKHRLYFAFFLSSLSVAVSLGMAYLSFFKIGAFCLLCAGLYLVNISIFILFPFGLGIPYSKLIKTMETYMKAIFGSSSQLGFPPRFLSNLFLSGFIMLAGSLIFIKLGHTEEQKKLPPTPVAPSPSANKPLTIDQMVEIHFSQQKIPIEATGQPFFGNPNSKISLFEFSDYQCPHCKLAAIYLKTQLEPYKKDLVFYTVNYPLDQSCNPRMTRPLHQEACNAAMASICAGKQNKFWEFHDLTFRNQSKLGVKILQEQATELGLTMPAFNACLASGDTKDVLKKDLALAASLDINGTPTLYVNGRRMQGWTMPDFLKAVIENEIKGRP